MYDGAPVYFCLIASWYLNRKFLGHGLIEVDQLHGVHTQLIKATGFLLGPFKIVGVFVCSE
jgi:hypothetical protein